jgi:hypothetical protein
VSVVLGQVIEPQSIRNSIERLYQTREFSYVEVEPEEMPEGLVVTFKMRPNFFFADFGLGGDEVLRSSLSRLTQLGILTWGSVVTRGRSAQTAVGFLAPIHRRHSVISGELTERALGGVETAWAWDAPAK